MSSLNPEYNPDDLMFMSEVQSLLSKNPESVSYPWPPTRFLPDTRRLKRSTVHEIAGLAQAGKSTIVTFLQSQFVNNPPERIVNIMPEWGSFYKGYLDSRELSITFPDYCFLLQFIKMGAIQYTENYANWWTEYNKRALIILERGANDSLAFDKAACIYTAEHPELHTNTDPQDILSLRKFEISESKLPDTVILFGISLESALARPESRGTDWADVKSVKKDTWPVIAKGYCWWLEHVYPLLKQRYGTGLLIVNGEDDKETNAQKVLDYINEVEAIKRY